VNSSTSPIRLLGSDFFLPGHAPIRVFSTVLDGNIPLHDHDFMEIVLVVSGTGIHRTIYGEQQISRGDAFILRPGAWHCYEDGAELGVCEVRFGMELLTRELAWTRDDPAIDLMFWSAPLSLDRRGVLHVNLTEEALAKSNAIAGEMQALLAREIGGGRAEEIGRLLVFVSELSREVTAKMLTIRKGKPEPHQAVTDGIRMMEEDIRRDWTLPELAKRLNVDKSYLVRLFRAHTSSPPMQFLAHIRAEKAAVLLLRTNRDISVIGEQVGWNDPNYFARRFKAHFGMSATKYREKFARSIQLPMGVS
jgi:AraC family transcriptional regulator, L-rhamnose operon transcriptional activator RhaR